MGIDMRIGQGYDVHRLVEGRPLIVGGVNISYEKGLLGHSDADVLLHAIMDSLLGAAALGDIGRHFPDTEEEYKGISSMELLKRVGKLLEDHFYFIENIDATIVAQKPKMAPYIPEMVSNIAQALNIKENQINVKATTEEGLGFTGEEMGISAKSVCLLISVENFSYYDSGEETGGARNCSSCSGCTGCPKK
ncbi:2-C-methyl-D-erythritol 2,4-cyclodiphosphate synthase [Anaerocolumna aminovalerica]|uniref:2-C-methyl-D-erythritol 2,4-cyclodiphosphate synthase n=2 Tax=Anaerocolumna aminovalerica TaxID=1527 RepID=A0A1I5D6M6_9FIRM|nr:2-C-methyl-D-erythritol 2,4-cyclodiphosphate synthase [Anaerocolumna aminovalerica]